MSRELPEMFDQTLSVVSQDVRCKELSLYPPGASPQVGKPGSEPCHYIELWSKLRVFKWFWELQSAATQWAALALAMALRRAALGALSGLRGEAVAMERGLGALARPFSGASTACAPTHIEDEPYNRRVPAMTVVAGLSGREAGLGAGEKRAGGGRRRSRSPRSPTALAGSGRSSSWATACPRWRPTPGWLPMPWWWATLTSTRR